MDQFWQNIIQASGGLVFALDVECWLSYGGLPLQRLNEPGVLELPANEFARRFNETFCSPTDLTKDGFAPEEIPLIDVIRDKHGRVHTRGCIGSYNTVGVWHIGGFQCVGVANSLMKGLRAGKPLTASRHDLSGIASKDELRTWGNSQLRRIENSAIDQMFKIFAIASLSSIDVDIRQHAMVIADEKPQAVRDIVANLNHTARIFVMGQRVPPAFQRAVFQLKPNSPFFGFSVRDLKHELRIWGIAAAPHVSYCEILGSVDAPTNRNSAHAALYQGLKDAGFQITTENPNDHVIGIYNGQREDVLT
jgi:hypothetical protein